MLGEGKKLTTDQLDSINVRKTGALMIAACTMGVSAALGGADEEEAAAQFGAAIGMAFQIRDDILDVLSTAEELGKPIGSDHEENKNTYMELLGREKCEAMVERLTQQAVRVLREHFADTAFLEALAENLAKRKS